jgi:tartrate dehydrogenase/decarboxylase/D-malate dehydrogenase
MMLEHLGETAAAKAIEAAITAVLAEGVVKTRDLGGQAGTAEMGKAIAEALAG